MGATLRSSIRGQIRERIFDSSASSQRWLLSEKLVWGIAAVAFWGGDPIRRGKGRRVL